MKSQKYAISAQISPYLSRLVRALDMRIVSERKGGPSYLGLLVGRVEVVRGVEVASGLRVGIVGLVQLKDNSNTAIHNRIY